MAVKPTVPTSSLGPGVGLLDLAVGALVIVGVESAEPEYARSHPLVIPWSHSQAGAAVFGALYALVLRRRVAHSGVLFAAVLSHWLLDVAVHQSDMTLRPVAPGDFGLVERFGPVSGWLETTVVIAALCFYAFRARIGDVFGRHWGRARGVVATMWTMGLAT